MEILKGASPLSPNAAAVLTYPLGVSERLFSSSSVGFGTKVFGDGGPETDLFFIKGVADSPVLSFHRNADNESLSTGFGATNPEGRGTGGGGSVAAAPGCVATPTGEPNSPPWANPRPVPVETGAVEVEAPPSDPKRPPPEDEGRAGVEVEVPKRPPVDDPKSPPPVKGVVVVDAPKRPPPAEGVVVEVPNSPPVAPGAAAVDVPNKPPEGAADPNNPPVPGRVVVLVDVPKRPPPPEDG